MTSLLDLDREVLLPAYLCEDGLDESPSGTGPRKLVAMEKRLSCQAINMIHSLSS